jgi:hypothetical protein
VSPVQAPELHVRFRCGRDGDLLAGSADGDTGGSPCPRSGVAEAELVVGFGEAVLSNRRADAQRRCRIGVRIASAAARLMVCGVSR